MPKHRLKEQERRVWAGAALFGEPAFLLTRGAEVADGGGGHAVGVDCQLRVEVDEEIVTDPWPMILKLFTVFMVSGGGPRTLTWSRVTPVP